MTKKQKDLYFKENGVYPIVEKIVELNCVD
jgi:hypothetical protein